MSQPYDRYPGSSPYGDWPPPYGVPVPPPRRRRRVVVAWTVAGSLLAAAVLAIIAVGGFRIGSGDLGAAFAAPSTAPPADWAVIGDDEGLDPYAERCHDGDMRACDELYTLAEPGSDYEYYALTCAGRVQPRDVQWCELLD